MNQPESTSYRWKRDATVAVGAGVAITLCIGLATFLMGYVGNAESRQLVEAILPTSRLLCSTVLTVTATILALMLTLLSLGANPDVELKDAHYYRIRKIAFYDAVVFGAGMVFFLLHCVPVHESDKIPEWWYPTVYYGILALSAILAGSVVSIIAMLYMALRNLVDVIGLNPSDE